ncbi:MAG: hypothetical protein KatS3mg085_196 [Candidatus Dojkabacteria bacterium]|nr:MAG: hypothetical protein KatS3mg085_196 [Candidatus Dojkabacteria bacterium]
MVDLTEISGIPIKFNEETLCIELGEAIRCNSEIHVSIDEINPVLLNKSVKYPEKVYRHYSDVLSHDFRGSFKYRYDIFVIPYGLLGIEYVKTHIFYEDPSDGKYDCVVEVLSGTLTVILQKNLESDEEDFWVDVEVEKVYIVDLDAG